MEITWETEYLIKVSMVREEPKIGIAGGAGPYAGIDLARMILEETVAEKDQDYLPTLKISTPEQN